MMPKYQAWAQSRITGQSTPWQTQSIVRPVANALSNQGTTLPSYQPSSQAAAPAQTNPDYTPYSPSLGPTGPAPQGLANPQPGAPGPATPIPAHQGAFITGPTAGTPYDTTQSTTAARSGTALGSVNSAPNGYDIQGGTWTPQGLYDPRVGSNAGSQMPTLLQQHITNMNTPSTGFGKVAGPSTPAPYAAGVNLAGSAMLPGESTLQYALRMGLNPNDASQFLASRAAGNG